MGGTASREPTRREFLGGAVATIALGACGTGRWLRVPARTGAAEPFPAGVPLYRQAFENWSRDIVVESVPTCAPTSAAEIVAVANWAARNGHTVRARGAMHTWSPLVLDASGDHGRTVLVDMSGLARVSVQPGTVGGLVNAQTGATLEAVLTELERHGYGFVATPAPGDVTIGGVLAIDGHGTAVPTPGEIRRSGATFGSLSNLVVSLTAVVWDHGRRRFRLRTFERDEHEIRPLLTNLGRTIVTEVVLQAAVNQRLRCVSTVDVPWRELFAAPGSGSARTFSSYLDRAGRVEAIWFPATDTPWLKVWSVTPTRPATARAVGAPYNYPFSEIGEDAAAQIRAGIVAEPSGVRNLGPLSLATVASGLRSTGSDDVWGWSKNLLLYVRPNTLRYAANGYAVMTSRRTVQRVLHEFTTFYSATVAEFAARGQYPASGPVEIRVTGLDDDLPELGHRDASPLLSAVRPRPDRTDWDVAIWLDILSFADTPHAVALYSRIERWLLGAQTRWSALVRPEWSKGWGYGVRGPWTSDDFIGHTVPDAFRRGYRRHEGWDAALRALDALDPHGVFRDPLLDRLMPRT